MKVCHLNCATLHPIGGRLVHGGEQEGRARMICHCLLIETELGLVLVDSGIGLADLAEAKRRLGGLFLRAMRPALDPAETAARQVVRLGYKNEDVRHIVLTHLDLDHAGGLADFPNADVHVLADEHDAASTRRTFNERQRYHPEQWDHGPRWQLYEPKGERWFGFESVQQLRGLPPEIVIIPLIGHTRGHCAVAVDEGPRWLLHAGDAYFHHGEANPTTAHCPVGLRLFQSFMSVDGPHRTENQERLRALGRDVGERVAIFSAHDPTELDRHLAEPAPPPADEARASG